MRETSISPIPLDRFSGLSLSELNQVEKASLVRLALETLKERHQPGRSLGKSDDARDYLQLRMAEYPAELFGVIFLDNRHRIIADEELFRGTVDGASIHPRVVVQRALAVNAAALIMYHNHPSGNPEPSGADQAITKRLIEALNLVDVRVLERYARIWCISGD